MECAVTTLGWPARGGLPPALWLRAAGTRVLVNCGENTQRFLAERQLPLARTQDVVVTRLSPATLGGLPGALLTVSCGLMCESDRVRGICRCN